MGQAMDMDRAYANGAFIAGAEAYPPRWSALAEAFREGLGTRLRRITYGPDPREALDLMLPEGTARGLVVFVHGGYWLAFGRESWSHLAAGPLAHGWAVAMPSYTLAPQARIAAITRQIGAAITRAAAEVAGPIVVTGHSAGGHLSARMANPDAPVPGEVAARVIRVLPISPLAELAPLTDTTMNTDLRLDEAEVRAESPARHPLRPGVTAHVHVGGQERPAFLWQARVLSEAWDCNWSVAPGRHHFDVIDDLAAPDSALTRILIGAA